MLSPRRFSCFFFFNDTATTEIYTLSLHDALPISDLQPAQSENKVRNRFLQVARSILATLAGLTASDLKKSVRSEEHTSELQSRPHLVCRLLLEKKKTALLELRSKAEQISERS